jgi:hypothetical protein
LAAARSIGGPAKGRFDLIVDRIADEGSAAD